MQHRTNGTALVSLNAEVWRTHVEQALVAEQHRLTAARRAILDWIAASQVPFTAETLVEDLVERQGISSRPTIYRTVDWLRNAGWVGRVQSDGPEHSYARLLPGHYHHAVCRACGTTLVVAGCEALQNVVATLHTQGFEVQGHLLELYGICANCRARAR